MILKIFNIYIPLRKLTFFFLESLFIWGLVILAVYLRFWTHRPGVINFQEIISKSFLIVIVVQLSLYYFDLYAQLSFLKTIEVVARLFQALSAASIILACLYYLFPQPSYWKGDFLNPVSDDGCFLQPATFIFL